MDKSWGEILLPHMAENKPATNYTKYEHKQTLFDKENDIPLKLQPAN